MKLKYILLIGLVGMMLIMTGGLLKVLHLPGANIVLSLGVIIDILMLPLSMWKIFTHKQFNDVLNT